MEGQAIYYGQQTVYITYDSKIVEWVSTDYPAISQGVVEAVDMAYFLQAFGGGGPVRWGLESESPPNSPTFQADVTNSPTHYGALDGGDLGHMAYDLGRTAMCPLKAGDDATVETIMAWFGYSPTGQMIDIGIATVPEWTCTDPEQRLIGISDPYGYRNSINSTGSVPWGAVKGLYR